MPGMIPDDLTHALSNGAATPTRRFDRKQTILSLVEALLKVEDDVNHSGLSDQPNFEDDRDVPTVDEKLQVIGAENFNRFQRRINNLDKELRNFANSSRQLGSSAGILSSAFRLRERLAQFLFLFRENASDLFPRKVQKKVREAVVDRRFMETRKKRSHRAGPLHAHVARPVVDEDLDVEHFPHQLNELAKDVGTFLECLNEFPEFTDEAVQASIISFQGDLRYWANCLEEYTGQFRYPAVQRYIHDLTNEMGEHIDSITSTLSMFIEIGVPTIRFAQKHGANSLLNLSTVATFFSAVTATTIQFSYQLQRGGAADAVNIFWFSSLVFSIAAAVNSLLGLTWKQAMYRSPGNRVPWWVLIWIKRSPLVFLVMSVACFSVGLCLFSYASGQSPITSAITTVLTSITSFGLLAVSTWFASERWVYLHHRGTRWLGDILEDCGQYMTRAPGVQPLMRSFTAVVSSISSSSRFLISRIPSCSRYHGSSTEGLSDLEGGASSSILPFTNAPTISEPTSPISPARTMSPMKSIYGQAEPKEKLDEIALPRDPNSSPNAIGATVPQNTPTRGKQLWINALRTVKMHTSMMNPLGSMVRSPRRQRTTSSSYNTPVGERKRGIALLDMEGPAVLKSRVAGLVPQLKSLETTHDLAAHAALVRHLQFSPNGKYLATSSWDRTSVIFSIGKEITTHRVLAHTKGFVGQVAWSPNGELLLTKLNRGIKIWTKDGVCQKTIDRGRPVESISWFPGGKAFISVEGSEVVKLNLSGKILDFYYFDRMKLHDVAVTIDGERLLGVGPLLESQSGLQPSKSRVEKRLVVYNMETKQCENQTPVLNDVRDITLGRNGQVALVSYENKAPPQLWKLEMLKDRDNSAHLTGRLTLRHSYMPKATVDFAGPSYFGGKDDELVLCAGKAGDIHIWDSESGALLHHVRAQALGGDLTCIAWNHAVDNPFMFATGCHDGAVRIWSKPEPDTCSDRLGDDCNSVIQQRSESPLGFNSFTDSPIVEHSLETGDGYISDYEPPENNSPTPTS